MSLRSCLLKEGPLNYLTPYIALRSFNLVVINIKLYFYPIPYHYREVVILESSGKKLSETSEFAKALEKEGLKGLEKQSTMFSYFMETGLSKIDGVV